MMSENEHDNAPDTKPLRLVIDESAHRPKKLIPPPDYTSRAVRLRLMTLCGLLILVMIAMREAGKPERWEWMGFERSEVHRTGVDETADDAAARFAANGVTTEQGAVEKVPKERIDDEELGSQSGVGAQRSSESFSYPAAAQQFWSNVVREMDSKQHRDLFRFLKCLRKGQSPEPDRIADFEKIVAILRQQRKLFHRDLLDQLSLLPGGGLEKKKRANELFESEQVWDTKILPAMTAVLAGEDFTVSQLQQIERLQQVLDPLIFAAVADETPIGWDGDSAAWIRMWEQIMDDAASSGAEPPDVSHLQLSSQPEYYRGRPVRIEGWVRSAREELLIKSEIGVSHYYQLLVRPSDSNVSPYTIYTLELPADFPAVTDKYTTLNQRITCAGLFFKNRTYIDAGKNVALSPLILAPTVASIADSQFTTSPILATSISPTTWVLLFIGLAVAAAAIAWWAFRTSETHRFQPGEKTTKSINHALDRLVDDPNVQTDADKIRELYE